jgi:hypothetical protein
MCGTSHSTQGSGVRGWAIPRFALNEYGWRLLPRWVNKIYWDYFSGMELEKRRKLVDQSKVEDRDVLLDVERFRQGGAGYSYFYSTARDRTGWGWGFKFDEVDANPIHWYHGEWDRSTSFEGTKKIAAQIGKDVVRFYPFPREDHQSIQQKYSLVLLDTLLEQRKKLLWR